MSEFMSDSKCGRCGEPCHPNSRFCRVCWLTVEKPKLIREGLLNGGGRDF
jgi:hypothetical protein